MNTPYPSNPNGSTGLPSPAGRPAVISPPNIKPGIPGRALARWAVAIAFFVAGYLPVRGIIHALSSTPSTGSVATATAAAQEAEPSMDPRQTQEPATPTPAGAKTTVTEITPPSPTRIPAVRHAPPPAAVEARPPTAADSGQRNAQIMRKSMSALEALED